MYYWELYSLGFIPTQLPLAAAEFALTGYAIKYINQTGAHVIDTARSPDRFAKTALALMGLLRLMPRLTPFLRA